MEKATIEKPLQEWAVQNCGAGAQVDAVDPMPGNAGISFGFDVIADQSRRRYVIRLAPPGVRRSASTDVLRQAPLLRSLADRNVPVAPVVWASSDEQLFGTDALIQEFIPGRPLHMTDASLSTPAGTESTDSLISSAVTNLATIHAVGTPPDLQHLEPNRSVQGEIDFWSRFIPKLTERIWRKGAEEVATELSRTAPPAARHGLLHGDFQPNNLLFSDAGDLLAVVDWELAGLGPQMLDLGWLCMFLDPSCWADDYVLMMRVLADHNWIREIYEGATEAPADDLRWFQGLAAFRFGVIASLNVKLHRSGRRPDPIYEVIAPSIAVLFERGMELCRPRTVG